MRRRRDRRAFLSHDREIKDEAHAAVGGDRAGTTTGRSNREMADGADEVRIRDLSRRSTPEWTPPIGALGGPPAHELYRDLVNAAGLQLCRGSSGLPWVVLKDGERTRRFPVPSAELRGALDRFRMRRNLRPVPDRDIEDFVRIVEARTMDPDLDLPRVEDLWVDEGAPTTAGPSDEVAEAPSWSEGEDPRVTGFGTLAPSVSISGGRTRSTRASDVVPRYLPVLRDLVREGEWMGTANELSRRIGDDPDVVFGNLIEHRIRFAETGVVVAPVEVEDGWQFLAVDRSRVVRHGAPAPPR